MSVSTGPPTSPRAVFPTPPPAVVETYMSAGRCISAEEELPLALNREHFTTGSVHKAYQFLSHIAEIFELKLYS